MTLTDGLVVLGVFGSIFYMIWAKLEQKNHGITIKAREWLKKTKTISPLRGESERSQQIYNEKRSIM